LALLCPLLWLYLVLRVKDGFPTLNYIYTLPGDLHLLLLLEFPGFGLELLLLIESQMLALSFSFLLLGSSLHLSQSLHLLALPLEHSLLLFRLFPLQQDLLAVSLGLESALLS